MSTIPLQVWVRVDQPGMNAVKVTVTEDSDIDDVIKAARVDKVVDAAPGYVTVTFRGTVVRPSALVSENVTSDSPLSC